MQNRRYRAQGTPTPPSSHTACFPWRYRIILLFLLICALSLAWRVIDLAVINQSFLRQQSDARTLRTVSIPAYRGMITDRNNQPLAISTPVDSIWVDPKSVDLTDPHWPTLAKLLNISFEALKARIEKSAHREFVYLKRGLDPSQGILIQNLHLAGIGVQREYRRYYPEGEIAAHLLGFTNIDDHGQEGLELAYDQWLGGEPGKKRVLKDRMGHTVADINTIREPVPGHNLTLSIDRRLQYVAYRELKAGIEKYRAKSGTVIVLDTVTGEILAMVNLPSYNPNNRPAVHDDRYRNRAVTDTFEPGSTIKTFSMLNALSSGKYQPTSKVNTSPGYFMIDGNKVMDDDGHDNGVLDMTTILAKSSNVGIAKVTLSLPANRLWETLHAVGFGQSTESGFPGEVNGSLVKQEPWRPFALATLSFGYGLSATPLQLVQAYAILAAGGVKKPISLLRVNQIPLGKQIVDTRTARDLLDMLEAVIRRGGTAPLAAVSGYRITGKTGTSHLVGPGGYIKNRYNSSFIGIAPASNPRLLVAVVLHDPEGRFYLGGYTAGPIFARVMGEALRLLDIPPDNLGGKQ